MVSSIIPTGGNIRLKKRQEIALGAFGLSAAMSLSIKSGGRVAIKDRSFEVPTDDPAILVATVNGPWYGWAVVSKSKEAVKHGTAISLTSFNTAVAKDGTKLYFRELTGQYQGAGVVATTSTGTMTLSGLPWPQNLHTFQNFIDIANLILPD